MKQRSEKMQIDTVLTILMPAKEKSLGFEQKFRL